MIELQAVSKKYSEQEVLRNISYTFEKSKVYFITGESGCGKTTLLNIIGGIDEDYEGIVLFKGQDISLFNQKEKKEFLSKGVSYISQFPVTFQNLTGKLNLRFPRFVNKQAKEQEMAFIKNVELKKNTKKLSIGEKQRVCINRCINQNAEVILADEPTSSLDKEYKQEVMESLISLAKDKVLIVVTHDLELAKKYGDEIIKIEKGRIRKRKTKKVVPNETLEKSSIRLSLFNSLRISKKLYKSEKKKNFMYNYSLVIGIVLLAFSTILTEGLMSYFQKQLLRKENSNYIEIKYDYQELIDEDYEEIILNVGKRYFDYKYKCEDIIVTTSFEEKEFQFLSDGFVNYYESSSLLDNEINMYFDSLINLEYTQKLKLDVIGIDFLEYVNRFTPTITLSYKKEDKEILSEVKVAKGTLVNAEGIYIEANKSIKEKLVKEFDLVAIKKFKGFIDDNLIDYLNNQDKYFLYENKLYKYKEQEIIDSKEIENYSFIEYGNIVVDVFDKIRIEGIENVSFLRNQKIPDIGRNALKEDEIVISSKLASLLFKNTEPINKLMAVEINKNILSLKVVGYNKSNNIEIYYNQQNYDYFIKEINPLSNFQKFKLKQTIYIKKDIDYEELNKWVDKQKVEVKSSLLEILNGMKPTMQGINIIITMFSLFCLLIAVLILLILNVLDFEDKKREYQMLKRTGYDNQDILRIYIGKTLYSSVHILLYSIVFIELMKMILSDVLISIIGSSSILKGNNYINMVFLLVFLAFFVSNINFCLYLKCFNTSKKSCDIM